jgi:hypothetical protein
MSHGQEDSFGTTGRKIGKNGRMKRLVYKTAGRRRHPSKSRTGPTDPVGILEN